MELIGWEISLLNNRRGVRIDMDFTAGWGQLQASRKHLISLNEGEFVVEEY